MKGRIPRIYLPLLLLMLAISSYAQPKTDAFLTNLFAQNQNPVFQKVIQNPAKYRLQIIYTRIDRDRNNKPTFTDFAYHVDSTFYFNPASIVKLPLVLLSLEKLNRMKVPGVDMFTPMQYDSAFGGQTRHLVDATAQDGYPSIAHFIKKALLVSENDPYSRMYEFVGQQTINQRLHEMGYADTRITHRFVRMSAEENRHTNPIRFLRTDGSLIHAQPAAYNTDPFDFSRKDTLGVGHMNSRDSIVHQPFDFSTRNKLPLETMHTLLRATLFPASVPARLHFDLTKRDYDYVYQYLSQFPGETNYPKYDGAQYYDSFAKFFFQDSLHHRLPEDVRVFNKVGWAYGFLTDASYVVDFRNNIEYMLSTTVYVNENGILNDNQYEYESVGHPFLYQLGQTIYQHELKRKRKFPTDLSRFKIDYEKQIDDGRAVVRDVDN